MKNISERYRLISLLVAIARLYMFSNADAEPGRPYRQMVQVGIYQNSPKVFWDEEGQPQGIYIDLVDEMARNEGWDVEYIRGEWEENLRRLETGELDLLVDVTYSEERARRFDFNKIAVIESWLQAFTYRHKMIEKVRDLNGKWTI